MEIKEIQTAFKANHEAVNVKLDKLEERQREVADRLLSVEQGGMGSRTPVAGFNKKKYSLAKAIRFLADPNCGVDVGYEREIHQEMEGKGFATTAGGLCVPFDAFTLEKKDSTVSGTGSNLVSTDLATGSFIDVLRNRSVIAGLMPTMLNGLVGDVSIPKKSDSSTAYWFAGDGADNITSSDMTLSSVNMTPRFLGGLSGYSHKLLKQSAPGIEQLIRNDLVDTLAVELDNAALNGLGASNEPTGILVNGNINTDTYTTSPSLSDVVNMETLIANNNANTANMAYLMSPAVAAALKTTDKGTDTGSYILENGMVNGHQAIVTNQMPADTMLLGDFSSLLLGIWGNGIEIAVDPSAGFASGSVRVRAIMTADFALRSPESFAKSTVV